MTRDIYQIMKEIINTKKKRRYNIKKSFVFKRILKSIASSHSSKTIKNKSKRDISAGPMLRLALSDFDLSYLPQSIIVPVTFTIPLLHPHHYPLTHLPLFVTSLLCLKQG